MLQLKCPNCGADIALDDTREFGFCSYCGTKVLLDEYKKRVDGIPRIANLLLRADDFLKQGNVEKAKEYYNRVLDIDIHNNEANRQMNMINKREDDILAERKKQEEAQEKENLRLKNDKNYYWAVKIANIITDEYKVTDKYVEGVVRYVDCEYQTNYGITLCSKEDAHKHVPTEKNDGHGLLQNIDIQKTNNELKQLLNKWGFKSDILFFSYEDQRPNGTTLLGNTKWVKTGTISYDVWIKIWK